MILNYNFITKTLQNNKLFKTSVKWLQTLEKGSVIANKQQAIWYTKKFFGVKYNFPSGKRSSLEPLLACFLLPLVEGGVPTSQTTELRSWKGCQVILSNTSPQKQEYLDMVAKDHNPMAFESLPRWRWLLVRH